MYKWTFVHLDGPSWRNIGGPLDHRPFRRSIQLHLGWRAFLLISWAHKQRSWSEAKLISSSPLTGNISNILLDSVTCPSWDWPGNTWTLHCMPQCTALSYTALHCTTLHYTTLHYTGLQHIALHSTALHCTALHCMPHCTALHLTTSMVILRLLVQTLLSEISEFFKIISVLPDCFSVTRYLWPSPFYVCWHTITTFPYLLK